MNTKVRHRYHLVDESPWPFLVSTASLFLTLGAVLFFHFSVQGEFVCCMMSFSSLSSKLKPKVLYFGGSVLANQVYSQYRQYSFRPIGVGKAKWNPDNYSKETQKFINDFRECLSRNDKNEAYAIMYAILGNKNGFFTKNYGKVTSVINNMIVAHNNQTEDPLSEEEFLNFHGFSFNKSDLKFLDTTNRGTIMSNISEILAPQIIMKEKKNILVERRLFLEDKINLSGQKNPEYSVGLFMVKDPISSELSLVIYDSDLKITEENSLSQKYLDLGQKQNLSFTAIDKSNFGLNIVIVACHDDQNSEIIFEREKINIIITELNKIALKYPEHFRFFNTTSTDFLDFVKTGKASSLNKSDFPVVKYYRPIEFYKLPHDNAPFEKSKTYLNLVKSNNEREFVKKIAFFPENITDDNN